MPALLLGAAPTASAVTRYAAPGGTADASTCVTPAAAPCSIEEAAEDAAVANGDEVVIAPGEYSDTAGDLGTATGVSSPAQIEIHGEAGQPRPVISLDTNLGFGAFIVGDGQTLSHVRVESDAATNAVSVFGGVAEDVIARTSADSGIACNHAPGLIATVIRDSVCLSSGDSGVALGASIGTFAGTHPAVLRNVTAIATGSGSTGVSYRVFGAGVDWNVDAKSVIAEGVTDAFAGGFNAADTSIVFDASNYATTNTGTSSGGIASVTAAGSGSNQTAAPLFAPDGFHQLVGSPTVGAGAADASSGAADIDGQLRSIPAGDPDIGADELGNPTTTAVACAPASLILGSGASTCTATVTDTGASPVTPAGSVSFASDSAGGFAPDSSCTLSGGGPSAGCQLTYTPSALGSGTHVVSAGFALGGSHEASAGAGSITVTAPAAPASAGTKKKCKRKKAKQRAAAAKKKKCKKKKKRKK